MTHIDQDLRNCLQKKEEKIIKNKICLRSKQDMIIS